MNNEAYTSHPSDVGVDDGISIEFEVEARFLLLSKFVHSECSWVAL